MCQCKFNRNVPRDGTHCNNIAMILRAEVDRSLVKIQTLAVNLHFDVGNKKISCKMGRIQPRYSAIELIHWFTRNIPSLSRHVDFLLKLAGVRGNPVDSL